MKQIREKSQDIEREKNKEREEIDAIRFSGSNETIGIIIGEEEEDIRGRRGGD